MEQNKEHNLLGEAWAETRHAELTKNYGCYHFSWQENPASAEYAFRNIAKFHFNVLLKRETQSFTQNRTKLNLKSCP
jgi:hypothetical protein